MKRLLAATLLSAAPSLSLALNPPYVARVDVIGRNATHAVTGDVDGDGLTDLVAVTHNDSKVKIYYGRGDGTFRFPPEAHPTDRNPIFVAIADLTDNGITLPDILVVTLHGQVASYPLVDGDLAIFTNSGDPPGSPAPRFQSSCDDMFLDGSGQQNGNQPNFALLADFNADSLIDIVSSTGANTIQSLFQGFANMSGSCVLQQTCDFGFAVYPGRCTPLGTGRVGPKALAAGVFAPRVNTNRDVVALNSTTAGERAYVTYHFHANSNTSGFSNLSNQIVDVGDGMTKGLLPLMLVADRLNGDTIPDLLVADSASAEVSVLTATDAAMINSRFFTQPSVEFPANQNPVWVDTGEFFAGTATTPARDAVVANKSIDAVSVLPGRGDATFLPPQCYPVGISPSSVQVLDVNQDAIDDLVLANEGGNSLSVLLGRNTVNGGFDLAYRRRTRGIPIGVAAGDFNGDSSLDAAFLNGDSADVAVILGRGDASFEEVYNKAPVGALPAALTAGRFNDMGSSDGVAVVSDTPGELRILLPIGDGSLRLGETHPLPDGAAAVIALPLDAGATIDLVVAIPAPPSLRVFLGGGDGTFQSAPTVSIGGAPGQLAAADLDGANGVDVVALEKTAANVTVLLNDGAGRLTARSAVQTGALDANGLAVGRVDGDNFADVVVTHADGRIVVLLGDGAGGLTPLAAIAPGEIPSSPLVGELTGGGSRDVGVLLRSSNLLLVLPWDATAANLSLPLATSYGTGAAPMAAIAGRFDAAATTLDTIVIADSSRPPDDHSVTVLSSRRHASFPPADAGPDRAICSGAAGVTIGTPAKPWVTYSWMPMAGLSDPRIAQPTATMSGTYTVTVSADPATGLQNTDSATITVVSSPTVDIQPNPARYCVGGTPLVLDAGAGFASYQWSTGAATRTISVAPAVDTVYSVTVTNSGGCSGNGMRSVTVGQAPVPVVSVTPTTQCAMSPQATFVADATATMAPPASTLAFRWSFVEAVTGWTFVPPSADQPRVDIRATPAASPAAVTLKLDVTANPGGCVVTRLFPLSLVASGSPVGVGNSLAAKRVAGGVELSWAASGSPSYDAHSVLAKTDIPNIFAGPPDESFPASPGTIPATEMLRFFQVRGRCP